MRASCETLANSLFSLSLPLSLSLSFFLSLSLAQSLSLFNRSWQALCEGSLTQTLHQMKPKQRSDTGRVDLLPRGGVVIPRLRFPCQVSLYNKASASKLPRGRPSREASFEAAFFEAASFEAASFEAASAASFEA